MPPTQPSPPRNPNKRKHVTFDDAVTYISPKKPKRAAQPPKTPTPKQPPAAASVEKPQKKNEVNGESKGEAQ